MDFTSDDNNSGDMDGPDWPQDIQTAIASGMLPPPFMVHFTIPTDTPMKGRKAKVIESVDEVVFESDVEYEHFRSEVCKVLNKHPDKVDLAYKFSTSTKAERALRIKCPLDLFRLFDCAEPYANMKIKARKPFRVELYDVTPKEDDSESEAEPKAKKASNMIPMYLSYILINHRATRQARSTSAAHQPSRLSTVRKKELRLS